jgi:hypothetical protein
VPGYDDGVEGEDRSRYAHTQFHEHQRPKNWGSYPDKEERPTPECPQKGQRKKILRLHVRTAPFIPVVGW